MALHIIWHISIIYREKIFSEGEKGSAPFFLQATYVIQNAKRYERNWPKILQFSNSKLLKHVSKINYTPNLNTNVRFQQKKTSSRFDTNPYFKNKIKHICEQ